MRPLRTQIPGEWIHGYLAYSTRPGTFAVPLPEGFRFALVVSGSRIGLVSSEECVKHEFRRI